MKNHRNTGALRLWALVAFLVCVAPNAFADIDTRFPFLSVDDGQRMSLWGGFSVQWALFSSITSGGVPALYYVALAAAMVGALSIIFNAKSQEFKTIASWLLVTIICLFAPYNSKLLFYDIPKPPPAIGAAAEVEMMGDDTKGFTPQLVAAHIGTTLQVIFTDIFNSYAIQSIVDSVLGKMAIASSPALNPGGSWLGAANDYLNECRDGGILPKEILDKVAASAPPPSSPGVPTADPKAPLTFGEALRMIDQAYSAPTRNGVSADFRVPPPTIELYADEGEIPSGQKGVYYRGLARLYEKIFYPGPEDQNRVEIVDVVPASGGSGKIYLTMQQATDQLLAENSYGVDDTQFLLYYLQKKGDGTSSNASSVRTSLSSQCSAWAASGGCNSLVNKYREAMEKPTQETCSGARSCSSINRFRANELPKELVDMPVGMFVYSGGGKPVINRVFGASSIGGASIDSKCDINRADMLFKGVFDESGLQGNLEGFKDMIANGTNILRPGQWKQDEILQGWSPNFMRSDAAALAKGLTDTLNNSSNWPGVNWNDTSEEMKLRKQKILALLLVGGAKESASINSKSSERIAGQNQFAMQPTQTGSILADLLGGIGAFGADMMTRVASMFAGATAVAIIYFLRVMIDIAMMGVIILTPVAFLLAIAMPQHAFGVLVQSFMIIGILKLVPVTFVIIDRLGAFVYGAIGAVGGDQQGLKQGLFLFAIAGLYASLVGMTMFLLFKIGDPQNISKLGELDKAAEKAADSGMKLAQALGTAAAGLLVVRPVLGAISGLGAAKDAKRGSDAQMKAVQEEGERAFNFSKPAAEEPFDPKKGLDAGGLSWLELNEEADRRVKDGTLSEDERDGWVEREFSIDQAHQAAIRSGSISSSTSKASWLSSERTRIEQEAQDAENQRVQALQAAQAQFASADVMGRAADMDNKLDYTMVNRLAQANMATGGLSNPRAKTLLDNIEAEALGGTVGGAGMGGAVRGKFQFDDPAAQTSPVNVDGKLNELYGGAATKQRERMETREADMIRALHDAPLAHQTGQARDLHSASARNVAESFQKQMALNEQAGRHKYDGLRQYRDRLFDQINDDMRRVTDSKTATAEQKTQAREDAQYKRQLIKDALGSKEYDAIKWGDSGFNWAGSRLADATNAKMRMQYMKEGMVGSFKSGWSESAGALAKIPVLGDILAPHMDEIVQGGQRARAKIGSGKSWSEYMDNQKKAKYDEYFSKEVGMQQKGMQYEQNLLSGTNYAQGQMVLARKAAAEAAAKVADEVRAALQVRPTGEFSVGDFKGAQLINALDSLNKTLQHAAFIQKGEVGLAAGGKVQLSEAVLQRLSAGAATWSAAKPVEALFEGHLKGVEKDIRYKTSKGYDIAARVTGDKKAIAQAAMLDMDTDYADLFEIGLVEKKDQFMMQAELAKAYRGILNYEKELVKVRGKPKTNANMTPDQVLVASQEYPRARMSAQAQIDGWNRGVLRSANADPNMTETLSTQLKQLNRIPALASRFDSTRGAVANDLKSLLERAGMNTMAADRTVDKLGAVTLGSPRLKAAFINKYNHSQFLDAIQQLLQESGETADQTLLDNLDRLVRNR